jgi:hypothetical protein
MEIADMRNKCTGGLVVVLLALTTTLGAHTYEHQGLELQGTWVLDRDASDDVDQKIDDAVAASVDPDAQPNALMRLKHMNRLSPKYVISVDAQNVRLKEGDGATVTIPSDGSRVFLTFWSRQASPCNSGDLLLPCVGTSAWFRGDALNLMLETDNTRQMRVFSADGDRLTVLVNVVMGQPTVRPILYKLVFTREN